MTNRKRLLELTVMFLHAASSAYNSSCPWLLKWGSKSAFEQSPLLPTPSFRPRRLHQNKATSSTNLAPLLAWAASSWTPLSVKEEHMSPGLCLSAWTQVYTGPSLNQAHHKLASPFPLSSYHLQHSCYLQMFPGTFGAILENSTATWDIQTTSNYFCLSSIQVRAESCSHEKGSCCTLQRDRLHSQRTCTPIPARPLIFLMTGNVLPTKWGWH